MKRILRNILLGLLILLVAGILVPQNLIQPVDGATHADWNPKTFWYYPWGKSITHKGVDIFANKGTNLFASTNGIVFYSGYMGRGGNAVLFLGPKWRFHYYAHCEITYARKFQLIRKGEIIAKVGDSGNAYGKPAHLHYAIITLLPYPWRIDRSEQGWKKMFYLNPLDYID